VSFTGAPSEPPSGSTSEPPAAYALGDVHGQFDRLLALLERGGLVNGERAWIGGSAQLWCVGDLVDRGPDGPAVIDLFMRLAEEAAASGGRVESLLGNHDLMLIAAIELGEPFLTIREQNGGPGEELPRFTETELEWLRKRPALAKVGDTLLMHADSMGYARHGSTISTVNRSIRVAMERPDVDAWDRLLEELSARRAFDDLERGRANLVGTLGRFGARRLVHGHTPIPLLLGIPAEGVSRPLSYAGDRCINVDGGMYLGAPGFLYRIPA
jgi:hypothetical protein